MLAGFFRFVTVDQTIAQGCRQLSSCLLLEKTALELVDRAGVSHQQTKRLAVLEVK